MQAVKARLTRSLNNESIVPVCDNSGAKFIKVISVIGYKGVAGRQSQAAIGDLILGSVKKGKPEMRKTVVYAIIVRQKRPYRRANGERIQFEDNAAVVLKDEKGNPNGTIFKGAIAKEVCERWPAVAKIANIIV
jgi:large subunit ribosomal protein L14